MKRFASCWPAATGCLLDKGNSVDSRWLAVIAAFLASGCASINPDMAAGADAYTLFPAPSADAQVDEYRIGAQDVLRVTVFQEEDLSFNEVPVDATGRIVLPLIGLVQAAGKTSLELSRDIAMRLEERYLVEPQVSIVVVKSASLRVTVEGAVNGPGIFDIEGSTTLLQALALAQGPIQTANLDQIIVFRTKPDGVYAARFNLADIRLGRQPNPEILGNDIVVVGNSYAKQVFRDFLQLSPMLATVFMRLDRRR